MTTAKKAAFSARAAAAPPLEDPLARARGAEVRRHGKQRRRTPQTLCTPQSFTIEILPAGIEKRGGWGTIKAGLDLSTTGAMVPAARTARALSVGSIRASRGARIRAAPHEVRRRCEDAPKHRTTTTRRRAVSEERGNGNNESGDGG